MPSRASQGPSQQILSRFISFASKHRRVISMTAVTRSQGLSRRNFLSVASIGAISLFGAGALSACGKKTDYVAGNAGDATLPKYIEFKGATPDIAGTEAGVPSAFYKYPKPFKSVEKAPLSGQTITAVTNIFGPRPTAATRTRRGKKLRSGLAARLTSKQFLLMTSTLSSTQWLPAVSSQT